MPTMQPEGEWMDYSREEWGNGSKIEFILYSEPLPGEDKSDQLHMIVTDCDGRQRGWLMNPEDAMTIIRGLSRLVDNAMALDKPYRSEDNL